MIKIYKYNPSSTWFKDVVNDSALKGKKRDIAIENTIKEHGVQISIVEYFKDWKRNSWGKDYCYACYGEAENSIERLVNAEINYDESLIYLSAKDNNPKDLIESRTNWDEMKSYADGLYWFINSVISDVAIGNIIISQDRWKPTEEQLNALHDAAVYVDKSMFPYPKGILMKLYEQLKKLKGE